jgi:transposase
MANVLSEEKKQQVLALGRLNWTLRRIEAATKVRRETASGYLKAAGIEVREPRRRRLGSNPASCEEVSTDSGADPRPASPVSTDSDAAEPHPTASPGSMGGPAPPPPPSTGRAPSASACEPYREVILRALEVGRDASVIYRDLVDQFGFAAKYASVRRFVARLRGTLGPEARGVIVTGPGEEGQVDYGKGPMVRDLKTGKYRRTRLFVLTLGYSRKSVRLLTFTSSTETWARMNEEAFRRLGGVPRTMVFDNLKEGVLKPDIYDPELNPLYGDVLRHYGVVPLPCRAHDPDRKGKVESGVGFGKRTLKGLRFESIEAGQHYLDLWEAHWADTRIHGTTKRQVAAMFAEERPHLQPLPLEPFRYYRFGKRVVHLDGHVEVECAYYSAPPGRIGTDLLVQWDDLYVRILDPKTGTLLREHVRQRRGWHRTKEEDRPRNRPPTTEQLLLRATRAGEAIGRLAREIYQREGEAGIRRIQGVLSLARKHGPALTEDAARAALEIGVPTYRFLRRYLSRHPAAQLRLRSLDPLIRDLTHYRDLITQMTEETEP